MSYLSAGKWDKLDKSGMVCKQPYSNDTKHKKKKKIESQTLKLTFTVVNKNSQKITFVIFIKEKINNGIC